MHGSILVGLKKFVEDNVGPSAWTQILDKAGLSSRLYLSSQAYPDEEVGKIVAAGSEITGMPVPVLLETFGTALGEHLVSAYSTLLDPAWKTLDVIERTEHTIHRVVRLRDPQATPPELFCTRVSADEVTIEYASERKLCIVARGLLRGIANHFGEQISVTEERCMLTGASSCLLSVKQAS